MSHVTNVYVSRQMCVSRVTYEYGKLHMNESSPVLQQVRRCLSHTCMSRATYESGFRVLSFSYSLTCVCAHSLYAHCTPQVAEALDKETYDLIFKAPAVRSKGAATRSVGRPRGATRGGGGGRGGGQSQEKQTINAVVEDMHRFCDTSGFWTSAWVLQVLYFFYRYTWACIHVCLYACVYDTCRGHARLSQSEGFLDLRLGFAHFMSVYICTCVSYTYVSVYLCLCMWVGVCGSVYVGLCMCVCVCVCIHAVEDGRRRGYTLSVESRIDHK